MKKKNLFRFAVAAAVVAALAVGNVALANETQAEQGGTTQEQGPGAGLLNNIRTKACEKMADKIHNRVDQFNQKKDAHVQAYNNLKDRVQKFIDKLIAKGYDTTALQSDLSTLNDKINQFATDYATYMGKMDAARQLGCGDPAQFKAAVQAARDMLKTVHQDAQDVRDYYRQVIRQDIINLKKTS